MFLDFVPLGWGYFGILASLLTLVSEPPPSVLVGFGCDPLDNDHLMVASEEDMFPGTCASIERAVVVR